jgi:uncharacterized protein
MITLQIITGVVAAVAGAIASVAGFGIGSLLTPALATQVGLKVAVAAVCVPHFAGTAFRYWRLRRYVDRGVLWNFGITSAAGGLIGALMHGLATSPALTALFASLLVFAGIAGLTGWEAKMRLRGKIAWIAGFLSGLFGGLVGNQGGIRSAAMLGIDVPRDAFVATATATALFVDVARLPVYLVTQGSQIANIWQLVAIAIVGVIIGTLVGEQLLRRIPEKIFRRVVSTVILFLGLYEFYVFASGSAN